MQTARFRQTLRAGGITIKNVEAAKQLLSARPKEAPAVLLDGGFKEAFQTISGAPTRNTKPTSSLPTGRPTNDATIYVKDLIGDESGLPTFALMSDYTTSPARPAK